MPKQYCSYLRVSTNKQGEFGLGIEAQREAVRRYVAQGGGVLLDEQVEVESGSVSDRPVLLRTIAECRRRKATLVVARLDRLSRSVAFLSSLMEARVDFVAVDAPFANPLILHILSAVAEHERKMIAERTRAAMQAAKMRGVIFGANGRKLADGHLAVAMSFAEGMRLLILELLEQGSCTLQAVADGLNRTGHRTREGKPWAPGTVSRIMRRLEIRIKRNRSTTNKAHTITSSFNQASGVHVRGSTSYGPFQQVC